MLDTKVYKFTGINSSNEKVKGEVSSTDDLEAIKTLRYEMDIQTILSLKPKNAEGFFSMEMGHSNKKRQKSNKMQDTIRKVEKIKHKDSVQEEIQKTINDIKDKASKIIKVMHNKRVSTMSDEQLNEAVQIVRESIFKSISAESNNAPTAVNSIIHNNYSTVSNSDVVKQIKTNSYTEEAEKTNGASNNIGNLHITRNDEQEENIDIKIDWSIVSKTRPKTTSKMKLKELVTFSHKMSILLSSGILLIDSLYILKDSFERKIVKETIQGIMDSIQNGQSLSESMGQYPQMFDEFYIAVIIVGESTGSLASSFEDLSKLYKTRVTVKKKARTASIYPMMTFIILIVVLLAMSKFFIPQFEELFETSGTKLPALTAVIFNVADKIPMIIMDIAIAFVIHKLLYKWVPIYNKYLNIVKSYLAANLPVIKKYTQIMSMYNFSSTMQIMLKNGIGLIDSLELSSHVVQNYLYKIQICSLKTCVMDGIGLASSARHLDKLDIFTVSMIKVGEESGNLSMAFKSICEYQQESLEEFTNMLTEMMQPLMTIIMGLVIGPIIIGIYLPLFQMTSGTGIAM